MTTPPVDRSFTLSAGRTVTIRFFRPARFGHVVRDHLLNDREPWHRVFRLHDKQLEKLRQRHAGGDASDRNAVEDELYAALVAPLAEAIEYSVEVPVYVEFAQERSPVADRPPYRTSGLYFLARTGFLVVVREDIVRTVRFQAGIKPNLSRVGLFHEAWKCIRMKALGREYLDSKDGERVRHFDVRLVSVENWSECPQLRVEAGERRGQTDGP